MEKIPSLVKEEIILVHKITQSLFIERLFIIPLLLRIKSQQQLPRFNFEKINNIFNFFTCTSSSDEITIQNESPNFVSDIICSLTLPETIFTKH